MKPGDVQVADGVEAEVVGWGGGGEVLTHGTLWGGGVVTHGTVGGGGCDAWNSGGGGGDEHEGCCRFVFLSCDEKDVLYIACYCII